MKILVTGGAGFIGSHLVDALIEKGYNDVVIYDNLEPQVHPGSRLPSYLNKKAKFVRGDVLDYNKFKKVVLDADVIFHLAAIVGVGQSQYEIKRYTEVNVGGTANLWNIIANSSPAVRRKRLRKVIVAGSMSSYGEGLYRCKKCGEMKPPLRSESQMSMKKWELICPVCGGLLHPIPTPETAPLNSNSIYALTKKVQEEMSLVVGKTYEVPTAVLRFFNVYGSRQSLSNPYTGVAAIFMSRIKNNNPPVIYEDGLQTRDFVYVGDVAKGLIAAMESPKANYEVFNLGSGKPITIKDVASVIAGIYGKEHIKPLITLKFRKGDVRHCYADISRIKRFLKFSPSVDFETGMKILCNWARDEKAVDRFETAQKELRRKGLV